jgi:hypothetical protein
MFIRARVMNEYLQLISSNRSKYNLTMFCESFYSTLILFLNTNYTRSRLKLGYMQEVMTTDELNCMR